MVYSNNRTICNVFIFNHLNFWIVTLIGFTLFSFFILRIFLSFNSHYSILCWMSPNFMYLNLRGFFSCVLPPGGFFGKKTSLLPFFERFELHLINGCPGSSICLRFVFFVLTSFEMVLWNISLTSFGPHFFF